MPGLVSFEPDSKTFYRSVYYSLEQKTSVLSLRFSESRAIFTDFIITLFVIIIVIIIIMIIIIVIVAISF